MNYKSLYHELNHRRKLEIELCHKSIIKASNLYDRLIGIKSNNKQLCEIRRLCNELNASLEDTYQELLTTDRIIEEMFMDEDLKKTIIYSFEPLNNKKTDD